MTNEFWDTYWEFCYQRRHGCPSQGIWQDIRNQIAFIFDVYAHATPQTDFGRLDIIIQDLNQEILFLIDRQGVTSNGAPQRAQVHLQQLMNRLSRLQHVAIEAAIDLDHLVLQELRQNHPQQTYDTNLGLAIGVIPNLSDLNRYVDHAVGMLTRPIAQPVFASGSETTLRLGSNSSHASSSIEDLQRISVPHEPTDYDVNTVGGIQGLDELPSYEETIYGIAPRGGKSPKTKRLADHGLDPLSELSRTNSTPISYCPKFEPPLYQSGLPPDYWSQQPSSSRETQRRQRGLTDSSKWSGLLPYRPNPNVPLLDGVREISSFFAADPRSRHTSRGAEQLGLHHVSKPLQTRPRRRTSACRDPSVGSQNRFISQLQPRRRSLEVLAVPPTGPEGSQIALDATRFASSTAIHFSRNTSVSSDFETNPESEASVLIPSTLASLDSVIIPASHAFSDNLTSSTIDKAIQNDNEIYAREYYESAEYLALAHESKNVVRSVFLEKLDAATLKIATQTWLPPDSHRQRPNRFDVLSLHGDTSILAYSEQCSSLCNTNYLQDLQDQVVAPKLCSPKCSSEEEINEEIDQLEILLKHDLRASQIIRALLLFINSRGNEYFCEIDEDYLTDRFNLTSLNTEVQYYQYALDLITDVLDIEVDDDTREAIEKSARHLYGLVHARYIVTTRGLSKMFEKYKNGDFGKCPRVACIGQPLLPAGQHDNANMSAVKLYCARCEDLYNPKSSRHAAVDGAYFGSSFHNMFYQVYPNLMPPKSQKRYEPKVFGFRVYAPASLARWQALQLDKLKDTLRKEGVESGFEEEEREDEMEDSDVDDGNGQDGIDDMFEGQRGGY